MATGRFDKMGGVWAGPLSSWSGRKKKLTGRDAANWKLGVEVKQGGRSGLRDSDGSVKSGKHKGNAIVNRKPNLRHRWYRLTIDVPLALLHT